MRVANRNTGRSGRCSGGAVLKTIMTLVVMILCLIGGLISSRLSIIDLRRNLVAAEIARDQAMMRTLAEKRAAIAAVESAMRQCPTVMRQCPTGQTDCEQSSRQWEKASKQWEANAKAAMSLSRRWEGIAHRWESMSR